MIAQIEVGDGKIKVFSDKTALAATTIGQNTSAPNVPRRPMSSLGGELPGRKIDGSRQAAFFSVGRTTIASSGAGFYILSASSTDPSGIDLM